MVKKWKDDFATKAFIEVSNWIHNKYCSKVDIIVEEETYNSISVTTKNTKFIILKNVKNNNEDIDLVIVLGGDGTILHLSSLFQVGFMPPVLAYNLGSMGFLTSFNYKEFKQDIDKMITGNYYKKIRQRLSAKIVRKEEQEEEEEIHIVLNEVVIDRGASPYLTNLDVYCDNYLVTTIQADGVIIASATGSTAYSLSAGGSLVHPSVTALLVTPICPHTLSFRPIILPNNVELKIQVPSQSHTPVNVAFDGRNNRQLKPGDCIIILQSNSPYITVSKSDTHIEWFNAISNLLNWNKRLLQKGKSKDQFPNS